MMTIGIQKKIQPRQLILVLLVLPFFQAWLPGAAKYLLDVAWAALTVFLVRFWKAVDNQNVSGLALWVIGFVALTLAVSLVQAQSGLYYLWGFRNNFRFYAAFFACSLFLSRQDGERLWWLLDRLFWVNFMVSLIQFLFFDLRGDYLGGLFGTEKGCNGATNLFFLILVTRRVVFYLDGLEGKAVCFSQCAGALLIAALAELKFFFVEFCMILLLAVLFCRPSRRKFRLAVAGSLGAVSCVLLLYRLFPEFGGWFDPSEILRTASAQTGYASTGDLNRLTAIPEINRRVFTSGWQHVFGLGLGNCDDSGFAFLTTPFYRAYSHLHYTWMSVSFLYLETGYLGLAAYFGFFVLICLQSHRLRKRGNRKYCANCLVSGILAVLCLLVGVYNASLRTEAAYLIYFALAQPFWRRTHDENSGAQRIL